MLMRGAQKYRRAIFHAIELVRDATPPFAASGACAAALFDAPRRHAAFHFHIHFITPS